MALSSYFYHGTTKRYIALFGYLFDKITIARNGADGNEIQRMIVPINYGPYQKWLIKLQQDSDLNMKTAIVLPRMSFEITNIMYDSPRKVGSLKKHSFEEGGSIYTATPYNIDFTLTVLTKYAEDAVQIAEQIIPFFRPEKTLSVELIPGLDYFDIPIIMTSVTTEDGYEADFESRRVIQWTFTFTMKAWYFGPKSTPSRIKFIDVRSFIGNRDPEGFYDSRVVIQPGLTEDGEPTTDINESIPYQDIEMDDDWATITIIEEMETPE